MCGLFIERVVFILEHVRRPGAVISRWFLSLLGYFWKTTISGALPCYAITQFTLYYTDGGYGLACRPIGAIPLLFLLLLRLFGCCQTFQDLHFKSVLGTYKKISDKCILALKRYWNSMWRTAVLISDTRSSRKRKKNIHWVKMVKMNTWIFRKSGIYLSQNTRKIVTDVWIVVEDCRDSTSHRSQSPSIVNRLMGTVH